MKYGINFFNFINFIKIKKRIRIASIFGAGLLVGTALCVIIPEGVSALLESSNSHLENQQTSKFVSYFF